MVATLLVEKRLDMLQISVQTATLYSHLEPKIGFEPMTSSLQKWRSTPELFRLILKTPLSGRIILSNTKTPLMDTGTLLRKCI